MIGVLGGTGKIGKPLVKRLAERGVAYRALAHSEASAEFLKENGAEVFRGDLDDPSVVASFLRGVDQLFLLTHPAPNQLEVQNKIVDLAVEAGVKGVVKISVYTIDPFAPSCFCIWHWHNEQHLKKSGLPYTILQPHTFMETLGMLFSDEIRASGRVSAAVPPDRKMTFVHASDVGDVAAALLERGNQKNETLLITGAVALSYSDCAKLISERLGRTVEYTQISPDDMMVRFKSAGLPDWLAQGIVGVQLMYSMYQWPHAPVTNVIQEVAGHPPRTFSNYLNEVEDVFR